MTYKFSWKIQSISACDTQNSTKSVFYINILFIKISNYYIARNILSFEKILA